MGLVMIREKHYDDALQRLAAAVQYDPTTPDTIMFVQLRSTVQVAKAMQLRRSKHL
jgi:hypothetical protein